jgi:voltage-gated potassium channel
MTMLEPSLEPTEPSGTAQALAASTPTPLQSEATEVSREERAHRGVRERGGAIYHLALLALSVYVLAALVAEALLVSDPEVRRVLQHIDLAVCVLFLADFFVNVYRAESPLAYLRWGWIDLVSAIPTVDPLRWGRLARIVRILRYLRALKSVRVLMNAISASRMETLSLTVFLIVFVAFTLSSALILEVERPYGSTIATAEAALWWAFLNIMNAKTSIGGALSPEGVVITALLNKVGLLVFAYLNSVIIAWLMAQRTGDAKRDKDR